MIDPAEASLQFDAAFAARAPTGLHVRPETDEDADFLRELFLASYPLRDLLPEPVLTQQVELRLATFRQGFPEAMRRIVAGPDGPIGRIIVDWRHRMGPYCADIAVRPAEGGRGVGTALLRAWIEVADAHGLACSLTVMADNPARRLYARLGFQETPGEFGVPGEVGVAMVRPPSPEARGGH
jgi:ribosomal protein S18 acetylase RimI-like enzyme